MKEFTLLKSRGSRSDKLEVALSCVILLFLWQIIAWKINNEIYLPTIGQVLSSILEIIKADKFYMDIILSIGRCIFSFIIALILSMIFGIVAYLSRGFRNFLRPINALASSIPTMVLVVLALIWFDKDNAPFIVGIAIVFPILYDSVLGAITNIDKNILEMAKLYNISLRGKILNIYLPAIKLRLASILLSSFSLALKVIIAGEVHGQPNYGIGTRIQIEKVNFNTSGIFAWIVIILIISVILDVVQKVMLRRSFIWKR
ncbi:ABC transporter permease subunit [Romboutsia weinsteinii]|uniref:ABC transporter permease subunit n=1 Tax=Romboutsia weinsteinii TaxID=2020949 RepID=A0A371IZF0_9FIRM|nr:ABC transporter permease subunit [Romboutsia weinsteinii]RDY25853.1 ABC transporter permease subunit [Romboutsia weinsteinii]